MLRLIDLIPPYYITNSRDMQILARTFEVILNYCKTNSDLVNTSSKDINVDMKNLMDLNLITLGFKQSHEYNLNQLEALLSIFRKVIRNKGNIRAVELLLELLSEVEDCDELSEVLWDKEEPYKLIISIPEKIKDLSLFNDLLEYILPSGISFEIQHTLYNNYSTETNINIQNESAINVYRINALKTKDNEEDTLVDSYISGQIPQIDIINQTNDNLYSNEIIKIPTTEAEMNDLQNSLSYSESEKGKEEIKKQNKKEYTEL